MRVIFALAATVGLAACNPMEQMNAADAQIEQFHEYFSASDFDSIYEMTAPEFRRTVTAEQWAASLEIVVRCLGPVQESSQTGFNLNTNNGVTETTINRSTTYELDEGTEVFTFRGTGTDMLLVNWEVVSPAMRAGSECLQIQPTEDASKPANPSPETVS